MDPVDPNAAPADAVLRRVLARFVHDVNNHLNLLLSTAHLVALDAEDPAAVRAHAARLQDGVERSAALMQRVGRFLRRTPGMGDDAVVDLARTVKDALDGIARGDAPDAAGTGAGVEGRGRVRTELTLGDGAEVRGHPQDLRLAIERLLDNAVRAMPHGGTLQVRVVRDGDDVVCTIADSGIGMPPEQLARLGEPFANFKQWPGAGLGVAEAQGIVQRHGGRMTIASTVGQGTSVVLRIPGFTGAR